MSFSCFPSLGFYNFFTPCFLSSCEEGLCGETFYWFHLLPLRSSKSASYQEAMSFIMFSLVEFHVLLMVSLLGFHVFFMFPSLGFHDFFTLWFLSSREEGFCVTCFPSWGFMFV